LYPATRLRDAGFRKACHLGRVWNQRGIGRESSFSIRALLIDLWISLFFSQSGKFATYQAWYQAAEQYNLPGVAYWQLGYVFLLINVDELLYSINLFRNNDTEITNYVQGDP
jgi:hypothetical protein